MTTPAATAAALADLDSTVVAKADGFEFTRGELLAYFNRVANRTNWKFAINAPANLKTARDLAGMREAVIFFTGSVPSFREIPNTAPLYWQVTAAGYYATIGA